MPAISAVIRITDINGFDIAPARPDGTREAIVLVLGPGVTATGSADGRVTLTATASTLGATPLSTPETIVSRNDVGGSHFGYIGLDNAPPPAVRTFTSDSGGFLLMNVSAAARRTALRGSIAGQFHWDKDAADAGALTTTAATWFAALPDDAWVYQVQLISYGVLTADDTDYATITVEQVSINESTIVETNTVASVTTQITGGSGDWDTNSVIRLPITTALVSASIGDNGVSALRVSIAKAGAGVVVPRFFLLVLYKLRDISSTQLPPSEV
jgi:hypothetical protein